MLSFNEKVLQTSPIINNVRLIWQSGGNNSAEKKSLYFTKLINVKSVNTALTLSGYDSSTDTRYCP